MRVRNGRFAEIIGPWPDSESQSTACESKQAPAFQDTHWTTPYSLTMSLQDASNSFCSVPSVSLDTLESQVVLHPDAEIIYPSMDVEAKGCIPVVHGDTATASGKAAQPGFETIDGFLSGSKLHPFKGEAQKGTVLSTDNFTFDF